MGRPLKIQKLSTGSGNGGASVGIDLGFPNFGSLTNPVKNTVGNMTNAQYLGVVGGAAPTDAPSATNPRVDVIVNIQLASGSGAGVAQGYIIRQKGSRKYLVGDVTTINDEDILVGNTYMIVTVGDTNWQTAGAPVGAGVGTVFTCTSVDVGGTGTANLVGVCVLDNDVTPAAGLMAITYTNNNSTATPISKLTNKFLLDFAGGSGFSQAEVTNDVRFSANFFTDEGTVIKSGTTAVANVTGQQNLLDVVIVDNVTS
jgi:hypothetical protein